MKAMNRKERREQKRQKEQLQVRDLKVLGILIVFILLSVISSFIIEVNVEDEQYTHLPKAGGLYGPFTIHDDGTPTSIKISRTRAIDAFDWDALDIEILDANKNYMASFGAEFWKETGRDSDGRWSEEDNDAELRYFFHQKGEYFLKVTTQSTDTRKNNQLYYIAINQKLGSGEVFSSFGFILMWIAAIWFFYICARYGE